MLSVVSSAVESPSPPWTEQKEVINSGKPDFTAQGLSPSCGNALWLPWVILTVPMATWPLWSAQVRQGKATILRMLLEWNFPRAENKRKQASKGRYYVVKLLNSGFNCSLLKNPILRDKRGVKLKIALLSKPAGLGSLLINSSKEATGPCLRQSTWPWTTIGCVSRSWTCSPDAMSSVIAVPSCLPVLYLLSNDGSLRSSWWRRKKPKLGSWLDWVKM